MKRVLVIGCPGAGKSTFSQELARITELPLIHLDFLYHDQSHSYKTDTESWRSRVVSETKKKRWIIDGNYKSTFDLRFPEADTIIFLDYPTYLSTWRAIKRRIQCRKKTRKDMPPTWKERLDWEFLLFILKFNRSVAPQIRRLLESYPDKDAVVLRSPHEAGLYLDEKSKSLSFVGQA